MPCRAFLIALLSSALLCAAAATARAGDYQYDARMAFIKAGKLELNLSRQGKDYEVVGEFQTSKAMSAYYRWNGIFAARGEWAPRGPVTQAYMSRTVSKGEKLKIVLNTEAGVRLLDGAENSFESIDKPQGIDLISALFFTPECYQGGTVNDGEDTYQLQLRSQKDQRMSGGKDYYSGAVTVCKYNVIDHKDRKRRIEVSLASVDGSVMTVQVRAKIPVLPDAVFKLRLPPRALDGAAVAQIATGSEISR